jgi:protein-glutamine gamma-glutamyltransferase
MFSFLARHRRIRNRRLGLIEETTHFNFGNVLFVTALVSASIGAGANTWTYLPGLVILGGWALLAAGRSRPRSLVPVLLIAGVLAVAGQIGLDRAEDWLSGNGGSEGSSERFDPNFNSTLIGAVGSVQQSPGIVWRLRTVGKSRPPKLLRTATFNNFLSTNWQNQRTDFEELNSRIVSEDTYYFLQESQDPKGFASLPSFTLRGSVSEKSPLPVPGDAIALKNFALTWAEANTFGCVRLFPKNSVIDGEVFWNSTGNPEEAPSPSTDLQIPPAERDLIRATAENLRLGEISDVHQKLAFLRKWFQTDFRYTRDLRIRQPSIRERLGDNKPPTALDQFLNTVRSGHCEYFATAATLLLREAGVQVRYATGYALVERDFERGEYVIRGTHGHAWCRVWDDAAGRWIDFDPTPQDWFAAVNQENSAMQRFLDSVKRLREDLFIWRNRPSNQLAISLVMAAIGLSLSGFIVKRLWHTKRQVDIAKQQGAHGGPLIRTPLHALETRARRHLGPRPPGQPFTLWLARLRPHLPDAPILDEAIALHQRLRFDPAASPPALRDRLAELVSQIESRIGKRTRK